MLDGEKEGEGGGKPDPQISGFGGWADGGATH